MMNYHNITKDDMLNGDGLRVVLWVAGCGHHCKGCQNPITWNPDDGEFFTGDAIREIYTELDKDHISGITFSGGDPLFYSNRTMVHTLCHTINQVYPNKTIWMYTGYTWDAILRDEELMGIVKHVDVLVDGRFEEKLLDKTAHWVGSTNQRIIDVQKSLEQGMVVLYASR